MTFDLDRFQETTAEMTETASYETEVHDFNMGEWGQVLHGLVAMINVVSVVTAWFVCYSWKYYDEELWRNGDSWSSWNMGDMSFRLTYWWDKMWNIALLLTVGIWGHVFFLWAGMAFFNSPIMMTLFGWSIWATAAGEILMLASFFSGVFSLIS